MERFVNLTGARPRFKSRGPKALDVEKRSRSNMVVQQCPKQIWGFPISEPMRPMKRATIIPG